MMNLTNKDPIGFTQRLLVLALLCLATLFMTGCQTTGGGVIPSAEYEKFTPKPAEKRIMKEVNLRWEVRDDVAQYCARSIGMGREQAYITPPVACALWHAQRQECVIVTGKETTHVALGHEVRHCFEGHFHK
jgi:hypothetical protein